MFEMTLHNKFPVRLIEIFFILKDIIVYNHGGGAKVPPGLPKSPMTRQRALPSQYLDERYHNLSQRYNYYRWVLSPTSNSFSMFTHLRSRSQDAERPRTHDKWLQTDFDESSTTRTISHSVERTYRSYSSHLYDRHAHIRDYTPKRYSEEHSTHFSSGGRQQEGQQNGGYHEKTSKKTVKLFIDHLCLLEVRLVPGLPPLGSKCRRPFPSLRLRPASTSTVRSTPMLTLSISSTSLAGAPSPNTPALSTSRLRADQSVHCTTKRETLKSCPLRNC